MVVTRKTPLVPAPPTSRTNSSQPIPRTAKGKAPQTAPNTPDLSSPLVNGEPKAKVPESDSNGVKGRLNAETQTKGSKAKHKSKGKKHGKKKKSPSLADVLLRFLLLFFTIYTVSVCPNDTALQSPICRALFEYRRLILDPLILPPINFALSHPSVSPYVTRAKPHYDKVVKVVTPVVARTQLEWNARVVPQWNKRLVPQWNKYAAPQLAKLDSKIGPYRNRVITEYNTRLAPHIYTVASNLQLFQTRATPYVRLVASKTHSGYQKAAPYAKPLWTQIKALIKQLLVKVGELRREFVDPHVATIWEKVVELSSGKPSGSPVIQANEPEAAPVSVMGDHDIEMAETTTVELETTLATTEEHAATLSPSSLVPEPVVTSPDTAASSSTLPSVAESKPLAVTEPEAISSDTFSAHPAILESTSISEVLSSSAKEELESASSVASASASGASSVVSSLADEISSATTPDTTAESDEDDDLDLDEFYRDLDLESSGDDDVPDMSEPPPQVTLTEEQKEEAERLHRIEVAKKRADIEGRHTKWEEEVQAMSVSMDTQLRNSLSEIRKAAVIELNQSPQINGELDALVKDAEKFLKGAEGYYKNLKKDDVKSDAEKEELWIKVVGKVEEKFTARLGVAEGVVNAWYKKIRDTELEEVQSAVFAVKDIADRGQADIGLDYAWLDDVTVDDWKRYHDLMRSHMNFSNEANMIQNGSHPTAAPNPVLYALSDLQTEVQEIVLGFQTRLRKLERDGQHAFGGTDPLADSDFSRPSEPEVSILPISGDDQLKAEAGQKGPPIVIGRGKQEVLEALGRVEEQAATNAENTELKRDAEEVVEIIMQEAESSAAAASHLEL